MITEQRLAEARGFVSEQWGNEIVAACDKCEPLNMDFGYYVKNHTIACGGDWGAMLLYGVKQLRPSIWDMIPENMGRMAFVTICHLLTLLGISEE